MAIQWRKCHIRICLLAGHAFANTIHETRRGDQASSSRVRVSWPFKFPSWRSRIPPKSISFYYTTNLLQEPKWVYFRVPSSPSLFSTTMVLVLLMYCCAGMILSFLLFNQSWHQSWHDCRSGPSSGRCTTECLSDVRCPLSPFIHHCHSPSCQFVWIESEA